MKIVEDIENRNLQKTSPKSWWIGTTNSDWKTGKEIQQQQSNYTYIPAQVEPQLALLFLEKVPKYYEKGLRSVVDPWLI